MSFEGFMKYPLEYLVACIFFSIPLELFQWYLVISLPIETFPGCYWQLLTYLGHESPVSICRVGIISRSFSFHC